MKDRLFHLKEFIDKNGKVTLHELECAFPNVSSMTLRRDLNRLEQENAALRVSGGAVSVNTVLFLLVFWTNSCELVFFAE